MKYSRYVDVRIVCILSVYNCISGGRERPDTTDYYHLPISLATLYDGHLVSAPSIEVTPTTTSHTRGFPDSA